MRIMQKGGQIELVTMDSTTKLSLSQLEAELEEKQNDLFIAAELGQKLLTTNQELQNQLEANTKEYTEKIESLEQERYTLQKKLECQKATYEAVHQELEATRSRLEQEHGLKLKHAEEVLTKKIHELSSLNEDLKSDNEKLEVQARTFSEKVKKQEETIEQLREEVGNHGNDTILQHELQDMYQLYTQEKCGREELQLRLLDVEGGMEVVQVENTALLQKVSTLEEECQERCRMANEWYEALKEAKDQNTQLNAQIEALKVELMGDNHHNTGNSLFGEVDNRRLDVERKMLSLQVKYNGLVKTHAMTSQQLAKLKTEMSALLCRLGTTTADAAQVQRLQRALAQSKSESQALLSKLHKLEKQQAEGGMSSEEKRKLMSAFVDFGDKAEYIQFLEHELEQGKVKHSSVMKELDMKRTQLLWETNKLSEAESKLYHSEQEQAKFKKEVTKLRIKVHEVLEKLNQANLTCKQLEVEKKFLDQELKSRGWKSTGKSTTNEDHRSKSNNSRGNPSQSAVDSQNSSKSERSTACRDGSVVQSNGEQSSSSELKSVQIADVSRSAPSRTHRKEMSFLEDLDKEFNRQKQQQLELGGVDEKRMRKTTDRAVENRPLPPVIYANSSENKCPQQ